MNIDIDSIIIFLKQFRGSLFKHIKDNPMRDISAYNQKYGPNGIAVDDFCSMLIYGIYQVTTSHGPDFEDRYELKLTTCNAQKNKLKGDITICHLNENELYDESNFKKKIENIIIVVGFSKTAKKAKTHYIEDENGCLVDVLKLNPDMKNEFFSKVCKNYNKQINRYKHGETKGVVGLLKLDVSAAGKSLKLTVSAVEKYMVSCFEESKSSPVLEGVKKLPLKIRSELYLRWKNIYQNPLDRKTFRNRLENTHGYRSVVGIPIRHEKLKIGENKVMPNGEIWRGVRTIDDTVEINIY